MNKRLLLINVVTMFLLSGCGGAQFISKKEAFPGMYDEKPVSILVVPSINNSTAADAPNLYASTINEPLSNAGFYTLPTEVTDRFLRNEGLTDGAQIREIAPQKFAEIFGADAVFYATINKWDTSYYVIGGHVKVGINFELISSKTGEKLWQADKEITIDTSGDSSAGILGAIVATAIKTALQDYVPVARQVNVLALGTVPFGKYHNLHNQDHDMPGAVKEQEQ